MKWSDLPRNPSHKVLRQFAAAWLLFFLAWAAWLGFGRRGAGPAAVLALVAILGGVGGWIRPSLLRRVFVTSMMLAFPIGWLVSLVLLLILFYGIFTPVSLLFRLRGRDALRLKRPPAGTSLWLAKDPPLDVRRYFRQY